MGQKLLFVLYADDSQIATIAYKNSAYTKDSFELLETFCSKFYSKEYRDFDYILRSVKIVEEMGGSIVNAPNSYEYNLLKKMYPNEQFKNIGNNYIAVTQKGMAAMKEDFNEIIELNLQTGQYKTSIFPQFNIKTPEEKELWQEEKHNSTISNDEIVELNFDISNTKIWNLPKVSYFLTKGKAGFIRKKNQILSFENCPDLLRKKINSANQEISKCVDYLKRNQDAFKSMNLKLYDIAYETDDSEAFYQFCDSSYTFFLENLREEYGIIFDDICNRIGHTSSFYLHSNNIIEIYNNRLKIDDTLRNMVEEFFGEPYSMYFNNEELSFDLDYKWVDSEISILDDIIDYLYDKMIDYTKDILLVYDKIANFKKNQVEYYNDFLGAYAECA